MNGPRRWDHPIFRMKRTTKVSQSPLPSMGRRSWGEKKIRKHDHSFDIDQGPPPEMEQPPDNKSRLQRTFPHLSTAAKRKGCRTL